ncbi:MAG: DNA polymerase III subunit alpha [Gammaproteobacteria bacterium]|nr:DNA polymerase III subunit alpha [Gammaproteobacteria bacterium]
MTVPFVHLRVHSEYSLADGTVRVGDLVNAARRFNMPAVAVTDLANLFAAVKLYRVAVRAGIKPLFGCDVWIHNPEPGKQPFRMLLLCQNQAGFHELNRLLTRAYTEGQVSTRPCMHMQWFEGQCSGLIALSGATEGEIGQWLLAGNADRARQLAGHCGKLFKDRFYIELQRSSHPNQEAYIHEAVDLAQTLDLPVVATHPVQFLTAEDFEAHEVRVCIQEGRTLNDSRRPRLFTEQQFFRSADEMAKLFADIPAALANSVAIAQRCNLSFDLGKHYLPDFPVPAGQTVDELLREKAHVGLKALELKLDLESLLDTYRQRLEMEIETINAMGFAGYFLIVADFIRWAKENDIPVGPGRGSGAGSLVAYALSITEIDPIEHGLLFERFLNPERVSLPDFDIDFCIEGRDRVIEYVSKRFGQDQVAQIITHGSMAARAVVRDVGRVLDHPYGFVDKLAKTIPFEIGMTLEKALEQEELLKQRYDQETEVKELLDVAMSLEGTPRNAGKHAGGVVIAPTALTDYTPLYGEQGATQLVTQLDMKDLEDVGLVKFDFLGLRTLTIIDKAVKIINTKCAQEGKATIRIDQIPTDDEATYALLRSCRTVALFQLESQGMRDVLRRLAPDSFDDIVASVALFRPGPLQSGMVDDFINRKHGRAKVAYPHPDLEPILKPTYGVILYQEQVMQIAQVLANYSLGAADLLRRAMGKKKPEEMAKQRSVFVEGATARGVNERQATHIFDLMEKFAGYGFNKSHSVAYALIAYQTAWLKTHYPASFMAAALSADMDHTDKVVRLTAECRDLHIEILPPDINRCEYAFMPLGEDRILYGLGAIKGIGLSAIEACLEARNRDGSFKDMFDLAQRVEPGRVNRRVFEAMIQAGALDSLGAHRASLSATLSNALSLAGQTSRDRDSGQGDIFGLQDTDIADRSYIDAPEWSEQRRLEGERATLGLFLTGHPIAQHEAELGRIVDSKISELNPTENRNLTIAGLVVALRTMNTRRGDKMAFMTLDDRSGRLEIAVFADAYKSCRELLRKDVLLIVEGQVTVDEYTDGFKMSASRIYDLDQARGSLAKRLVIKVDRSHASNGFLSSLEAILKPHINPGSCPVYLHYENVEATAVVALGPEWQVLPCTDILEGLSHLAGQDQVEVFYQ